MKVAHVVESTATGVLTMVAALANAQAGGHEVSVIFSRRPETPADVTREFAPRVRLFPLGMSSLPEQALAPARLRRLLRTLDADAVFLHSSKAGFLGRLALAGNSTGASLFYIPHCISFMRRDIGRFARGAFVLLESAADRIRPARYVACSESEYVAIGEALPQVERVIVENGVRIDTALVQARAERGAATGQRVVVAVGQLRPQKDPDGFAELAAAVMDVQPEVRFEWLGDGDPAARRRLEQAGVTVTGWLPREAVLQRVSGADVFVSTARWEGLPVAALEAMYIGLPMVLSDCAGNRDVVKNGQTGRLFRTPGEGSAAILEILSDDSLSLRFSQAARQEFEGRFVIGRYLDAMERQIRKDR